MTLLFCRTMMFFKMSNAFQDGHVSSDRSSIDMSCKYLSNILTNCHVILTKMRIRSGSCCRRCNVGLSWRQRTGTCNVDSKITIEHHRCVDDDEEGAVPKHSLSPFQSLILSFLMIMM